MMSYQRERDEFLLIAQQEGLSYDVATKLLRYAQTLHRLAVAQCNGDWPADNGERKVEFCPECESGFVRSSFKKSSFKTVDNKPIRICPDCRTQELVQVSLGAMEHVKKDNGLHAMNTSLKDCDCMKFKPLFGGDPRGCVLKIQVPSGRTNDWGKEGICVPVRDR